MGQESAEKQSAPAQNAAGGQQAEPPKKPGAAAMGALPFEQQEAKNAPPENQGAAAKGDGDKKDGASDKKEEKALVVEYHYGADELEKLLDANYGPRDSEKWKTTAQQWIAYGLDRNRAYVKQQMEAGDTASLDMIAKWEADMLAHLPAQANAAVALAKPRADWLGEVVGAYLSKTQMSQADLSADKGPAGGAEDKSAALTKTFVDKLEALQKQVETDFPGDSRAVVKELTLRRELFLQFADNHNKSNAESGISSVKGSVADKARGVTSCNAYQGAMLKRAFGEADKKLADGGVSIKETKPVTFDMVSRQTGRGKAQTQYAFYDNLGRAAKDVGAWTQGGPGVTPKAGDMYVLQQGSSVAHIGFFKFAETVPDATVEIWHTFDGGQQAGSVMTDDTYAGAVKSVQDGALNNIKRLYTKADNTVVIPPEAKLAEVRGAAPSAEAKPGAPMKLNQDGHLRTVAGFIDVGKLIAGDKGPKKDDAPKK